MYEYIMRLRKCDPATASAEEFAKFLDRERKRKEQGRKYALRKPEARLRARKRRGERIKLATPSWADLKKIAAFYKDRPEGMTVDHIVPLAGRNVCGLHVPWNLQYLTKEENNRKFNRH